MLHGFLDVASPGRLPASEHPNPDCPPHKFRRCEIPWPSTFCRFAGGSSTAHCLLRRAAPFPSKNFFPGGGRTQLFWFSSATDHVPDVILIDTTSYLLTQKLLPTGSEFSQTTVPAALGDLFSLLLLLVVHSMQLPNPEARKRTLRNLVNLATTSDRWGAPLPSAEWARRAKKSLADLFFAQPGASASAKRGDEKNVLTNAAPQVGVAAGGVAAAGEKKGGLLVHATPKTVPAGGSGSNAAPNSHTAGAWTKQEGPRYGSLARLYECLLSNAAKKELVALFQALEDDLVLLRTRTAPLPPAWEFVPQPQRRGSAGTTMIFLTHFLV